MSEEGNDLQTLFTRYGPRSGLSYRRIVNIVNNL